MSQTRQKQTPEKKSADSKVIPGPIISVTHEKLPLV